MSVLKFNTPLNLYKFNGVLKMVIALKIYILNVLCYHQI